MSKVQRQLSDYGIEKVDVLVHRYGHKYWGRVDYLRTKTAQVSFHTKAGRKVTLWFPFEDLQVGFTSRDVLTKKLTAFESFTEMANHPGDYTPTLMGGVFGLLASAYDDYQKKQGVSKRAFTGHGRI